MKYTRWSCRHIFNASSNFTHRGPPVFFLLHNRQTHSIDILHGVRAYALTLHSDISSRGFCCRSHGVLPTSSTPSNPVTLFTIADASALVHLAHHTVHFSASIGASFPDTFHNDWLPETPGCSDSIGPGCIEHLRRVSVRSRHGGVVCVSTTQLSLPAPSGPTCCLKSLLLSLLLQLLQPCFPVLHLFAANPAAQLRQLFFAQGFAQLSVR